jgi:hypothetical protein
MNAHTKYVNINKGIMKCELYRFIFGTRGFTKYISIKIEVRKHLP